MQAMRKLYLGENKKTVIGCQGFPVAFPRKAFLWGPGERFASALAEKEIMVIKLWKLKRGRPRH